MGRTSNTRQGGSDEEDTCGALVFLVRLRAGSNRAGADRQWQEQRTRPTANTGHVPVYNRAKFLARIALQLTSLRSIVGYKFASEHTFAAKRVLVTACDRQEVNERVKIPKPILDWRCGQHEDVTETPLL